MTDSHHRQRDSLDGFNRKRLRGTLRLAMGVKPNSAMFDSRGQSWHTTASEERQEAQRKQLLERQLREANKPDEKPYKPSDKPNPNAPVYKVVKPLEGKPTRKQAQEIEAFILSQLADPGPLEPVKVNKQQLAKERKPRPPARTKPSDGKFIALSQKVTRLAALQRQLEHPDRVAAKTTDKYRVFDHFIMERD